MEEIDTNEGVEEEGKTGGHQERNEEQDNERVEEIDTNEGVEEEGKTGGHQERKEEQDNERVDESDGDLDFNSDEVEEEGYEEDTNTNEDEFKVEMEIEENKDGEEVAAEEGEEMEEEVAVELTSQEVRDFFDIPLSPLPEPVSAESARQKRLAKVKLLKEKYRRRSGIVKKLIKIDIPKDPPPKSIKIKYLIKYCY